MHNPQGEQLPYIDETWSEDDLAEYKRVKKLANETFPKWADLDREDKIEALEKLLYDNLEVPSRVAAFFEGLIPSALALVPETFYSPEFLAECGWKSI